MGSYVDADDIQAEFKSIDFSGSTIITTAKVNEFITQEEALLNGFLSSFYEVPITGTISVAIIKSLATKLVKARIEDILFVKSGKKDVEQGSIGDDLRKQVLDPTEGYLAKIKSKELFLIDATPANSTFGVKSYTSANSIDQKFKKQTEQW